MTYVEFIGKQIICNSQKTTSALFGIILRVVSEKSYHWHFIVPELPKHIPATICMVGVIFTELLQKDVSTLLFYYILKISTPQT